MTDDAPAVGRRRVLRALGATVVVSGVAGCSGDGNGDGGGDGGSDGGDGGSDGGDESGGGDTIDSGSMDETETPTPDSTPTQSGSTTSSDGDVTMNVSLQVRNSRSNVEKFETLRTTFEKLELVREDGDVVTLDDATRDIDLTELGPGGSVDLFETAIPAGSYSEMRLYLPIQKATAADGSDPEFDRTVPASQDLGFSDPLELESGDSVDFTVLVALLRIAGDGPWTYTVGYSSMGA